MSKSIEFVNRGEEKVSENIMPETTYAIKQKVRHKISRRAKKNNSWCDTHLGRSDSFLIPQITPMQQGDEPPSTPPAMIGLIFLLAIGLVVGLTAKPSGSTVNVHLGDGMVSSSNSAPSDNLSGTSITVDVDVDSSVSINTVASKVLDLALPCK